MSARRWQGKKAGAAVVAVGCLPACLPACLLACLHVDNFNLHKACLCPTARIMETDVSGKKKQHKHKLFGPNLLRTCLTLAPRCPGVKKFLPPTGTAGKCTFRCGRPRFSAQTSMTRRVVDKLCTKKVSVDFFGP